MFKVGDKICYPRHGVCEVKTVFGKKVSLSEDPVYILKPVDASQKLLRFELSQKKAIERGVYYSICKEDGEKIFRVLADQPNNILADRDKGYEGTREKVYSGDLFQIAEAIRDLEALKDSFFSIEKRGLLLIAKKTLVGGLARVSGKTKKHVEQSLRRHCILAKRLSAAKQKKFSKVRSEEK